MIDGPRRYDAASARLLCENVDRFPTPDRSSADVPKGVIGRNTDRFPMSTSGGALVNKCGLCIVLCVRWARRRVYPLGPNPNASGDRVERFPDGASVPLYRGF